MDKQIEEMAKDMCEYFYEGTCYQDKKPCDCECEIFTDAQYLYAKGYRKERVGEWVEQPDGTHFCSNCGKDATYNYDDREVCGVACTYCGAKMKGE